MYNSFTYLTGGSGTWSYPGEIDANGQCITAINDTDNDGLIDLDTAGTVSVQSSVEKMVKILLLYHLVQLL
jgi:hypothetical protein